jgi:hypothetical protein
LRLVRNWQLVSRRLKTPACSASSKKTEAGRKKGLSAGGLQLTPDMNVRITITLPAIDMALFNIARRTSESG